MEFFYSLYMKTGEMKYYGMFLFLKNRIRYSGCSCKSGEWITLLPDGQLAFCAPRSKRLGSCLDESAYELVQKNMEYFQEIICNYCDSCGQYISDVNKVGKDFMYKEIVMNNSSRW